ncbi:MAG: hypothetical protein ACREBJ_09690 [Nitrosotalea sp.]
MRRRTGKAQKYINEVPCKKCETFERYSINRYCVKCACERANTYRKEHDSEVKLKKKLNYEKTKNKRKITDKVYRKEHQNEIKIYQKKYRSSHKKEKNLYAQKRREKDVKFRITTNLRTRINRAIKCNYKKGSAVKDLGCSIGFFKVYIESQFEPWMTWKNWKRGPTKEHPKVWHIDHIKPLSSFNLENRQQLLEACHYTNMRPLEASENLKKNNKTI